MLRETCALFKGLITVFKHLFKKPVTLEYPEKHRVLNSNFRGKPVVDGCVGCGLCQKVCPSQAITIVKNELGKVISFKINLNKCIFCGNCSYYCPKNAIKMSAEYELGTENKNELVLNYMEDGND